MNLFVSDQNLNGDTHMLSIPMTFQTRIRSNVERTRNKPTHLVSSTFCKVLTLTGHTTCVEKVTKIHPFCGNFFIFE